MPVSATAMRLIMRQIQEIEANPTDGLRIQRLDNLNELHFDIAGPEGTPFDGGLFHVTLHFDEGYPEVPPRGVFRTRIFHPNIAEKGDICVNVLKRDWRPDLGLRHVLSVIRCLLIEPNAESALNEEAARLLLEDYDAYRRKAEMMTKVHALKNGRPLHVGECGEMSHKPNQTPQDFRETPTAEGVSPFVMDMGGGVQLRDVSESTLNARGAKSTVSTNNVASKRAVEKKRAALKRI